MPQVAYIPPHCPFIPVLAAEILRRYEAQALPSLVVLLPNRRSCRILEETLLKLQGAQASWMPRILPLGDAAEALALAFSPPLQVHAVATEYERSVMLTQYILQRDTNCSMPQALALAAELGTLMDELSREGLPISKVSETISPEFAEHWNVTGAFLGEISAQWQEYKLQRGLLDVVEQRDILSREMAERIVQGQWRTPIIAAGSTGSVPSTALMLKSIANHEQGVVVLPAAELGALGNAAEINQTHPQFHIKQLLKEIGIAPAQLQCWGESGAGQARTQALRHVLAAPGIFAHTELVFEHIHILEASTHDQESLMIAALLREALERPASRAALVTLDRKLAAQVRLHLQRWNIHIDDSAGTRLKDTAPGRLLRLLLSVVQKQCHITDLLALFKHPACAWAEGRAASLAFARSIEKHIFTRAFVEKGWDAVSEAITLYGSETDKAMWQKFVARCSSPIEKTQQKKVKYYEYLKDILHLLDACVGEGPNAPFWARQDAQQMRQFLADYCTALLPLQPQDPRMFPDMLEAALAQETFRPAFGANPYVAILSPQEARLMQFDRCILGGLNQDSWPVIQQNPWMSLAMRRALRLPTMEDAISLAAHDIFHLLHCDEVYLTRSQRAGGTPTVPASWLLRLKTYGAVDSLFAASSYWKQLANSLHSPAPGIAPLKPPYPTPPLAARPTSLSVTQMERWIRNPYAIYALKILWLKKLELFRYMPEAKEFGTFAHKVMELAVTEQAHSQLQVAAIAERELKAMLLPAAIRYSWQQKWLKIGEAFVALHAQALREGTVVSTEKRGEYSFVTQEGNSILIRGTIDRIERYPDGEVKIIDYKTGQFPTQKLRKSGVACQLDIEALMLAHGAVEQEPPTAFDAITELVLWSMAPTDNAGEIQSLPPAKEVTESVLTALIDSFASADMPYLAAPDPAIAPRPEHDDYHLLARGDEWASDILP